MKTPRPGNLVHFPDLPISSIYNIAYLREGAEQITCQVSDKLV